MKSDLISMPPPFAPLSSSGLTPELQVNMTHTFKACPIQLDGSFQAVDVTAAMGLNDSKGNLLCADSTP